MQSTRPAFISETPCISNSHINPVKNYNENNLKHELYIPATTIEALFRPDPAASVEEQLYGATTNPLPVYEILYPLFAINARGVVTVWVASKQELSNIRSPLKVGIYSWIDL